MLSKFFLFYVFAWLLGNPLLALLLLFLIYYAVDRTFLGFLPDPFRAFKKSGRIRELQKTVSINPHDARSLKELGIFMVEKKDYGKALEYFERAAPKLADDPEFNYYYGISMARTGDMEGGRKLVDKALEVSPGLKYGEPYLMMAEAYIDSEDYRNALPLLKRFEEIHSSSSRGFYQLGFVQMKLDMRKEGMDSLKRAVAAFKSSPPFKRKLDRRWAWKARTLLKKGL